VEGKPEGVINRNSGVEKSRSPKTVPVRAEKKTFRWEKKSGQRETGHYQTTSYRGDVYQAVGVLKKIGVPV